MQFFRSFNPPCGPHTRGLLSGLITLAVAAPAIAQQLDPLGSYGSSPADPEPSGVPPIAAPEDGGLFSTGFFLKLGFPFIVGLAVGYALKIAFKVALVAGGLVLVALFGLQYGGIVEVNWAGMESNYDGIVDWLTAYAGALKGFMADNLSSAASFTAGLLLGLRV
jgi:uncharacterized membrane protein (Fun14 family)